MPASVLLAFALAVLPLSLTPGASSALVVTRVLAAGRAEGVKVAVGTACGLYVHATAAAVGLAALVMASSTAFTVLKLAGAAYLVVLGVTMLVRRRPAGTRRPPAAGHSSCRQAFLANVLNPKAASVYLTLLPQFLDPAGPVVAQTYALATVHVAVASVCLTGLSHLVAAAGVVLARPAWRTWTQRVSGAVLVLLGLRTATAAP